MTKKTVVIFGSGMMPPAIIDYYTHKFPCHIIIATIDYAQAEKLIDGNPNCKIEMWSADDPQRIDALTGQADLVVTMIPESVLLPVAESCVRTATSMIYTAYDEKNIRQLSKKAKEKNILILSEVGEDPGLDHLCTLQLLDELSAANARVLTLNQWGAGIPDHADNNNPMGYKFSWSPPRLYEALQSTSTYTHKGQPIFYHGGDQYQHFRLLDTAWGTFESVGHRSVLPYFEPYQLPSDISFFRGLLRHPGYCNTINAYLKMGLLESNTVFDYKNKSCREITADLVQSEPIDVENKIANFLGVKIHDDIIHRLRWLGLFADQEPPITKGTKAEYLLALQGKKMMYGPDESDITLILVRITAQLPTGNLLRKEGRLRVAGIPGGFSAMTRAVGYSVGVAGRQILEENISRKGCFMLPEIPELCALMRDEMALYEFKFAQESAEYLE